MLNSCTVESNGGLVGFIVSDTDGSKYLGLHSGLDLRNMLVTVAPYIESASA
jgi:hypothetical protein